MEIVRVESYAGHRGEQEPRFVHLDGRRLAVAGVAARWLTPGGRYFRLDLADGRTCVLRHDPECGAWFLVAVAPGTGRVGGPP